MNTDLLDQVANAGYSTAYGRDKCYSTHDIVHKTNARLGLVGFCIILITLVYPIFGQVPALVLAVALISFLPYYLNKYSTDAYLTAAKKLEEIERNLQSLYFNIKNDPNFDLNKAKNDLKALNKAQSNTAINSHIFGSDLYAHIKIFWTKRTNARWFINQLQLSIFDKIPFSAVVILTVIFFTILGSILAIFIVKMSWFKAYFNIIC